MSQISKRGTRWGAAGLLIALFAGAWLAAGGAALTQKEKNGKKEKDFPPPAVEILPANAVKFGAQANDAAPEELKKWAESLAKGEMRSHSVDPQATMKKVDERWPQESEATRDAITFLVFYLAYKDEDLNYRTLGYRIRDIDRETKEITRQLQIVWKNQENRSASPLQAQGQQARVAEEERIQGMESTLRDYADERQLKATLMDASRKKISLYLKLLEVAHKRMGNASPSLLRTVK